MKKAKTQKALRAAVPWKKRWPKRDCTRIEIQDDAGARIAVEAPLSAKTRPMIEHLMAALIVEGAEEAP